MDRGGIRLAHVRFEEGQGGFDRSGNILELDYVVKGLKAGGAANRRARRKTYG